MKAPSIVVELVKVTPTIAAQYLEKNTNNRPVNLKRVEGYAKLMKEGKWTDNGVIEFGKDGTLFDGQTRLQAVVKSKVAVWFTVKHGVSDESRANIDIGRARTAGNWLSMIGVPNGNRVAAALRLIHRMNSGEIAHRSCGGSDDLFTPEIAEDMLKERPDVVEWASMCNIGKCPRGISLSTIVAFSYLFSKKDYNLAKEFVNGMIDGFDKGKYPSFHKFRELIIRQPTNPTPYPKNYIQAFMVQTWNHERKGTSAKIFRWIPSEQDFPTIQ